MARGPVKHTCPDIDAVIKNIRSSISCCEAALKASDERKDAEINDAIWYLRDMEDEMEQLRRSNHLLREWGEEQEDRANNLENQLAE